MQTHIGSAEIAADTNEVGLLGTVAIDDVFLAGLTDTGNRDGQARIRRGGVATYYVDAPFVACHAQSTVELLLPDIIIKCVGLVLALAVYPPIMMYSVLIAAAYIITLKAVIDRKAKRKLEEICLWTKKEYVVELKA